MTASKIFLISSLHPRESDFPELKSTIVTVVPAHNRDVLMQCLPSVTKAAIDRKTDALKQMMFMQALKFGAVATKPFTGHISDKDIERLEESLVQYRSYFRLDDASLEKVAKTLHVSVEVIKANLQSPHLLSAEGDESLVEQMSQVIESANLIMGEFFVSGLYFTMVFCLQYLFQDIVAKDAKALLEKIHLFGASASS